MGSRPIYSLKGKRVFVAGHGGMVGSAIARRLETEDCEVVTAGRAELDLRDQASTRAWMADVRPDAIFLAAAKVGGILANSRYPADFLYDNLMIQANVVEAAHRSDVEKLLLIGSSALYPKLAPQPIAESALLTGLLEPSHESYAIAKIAGLKLGEAYRRQFGRDFISAIPTNLYGPGDNFDLDGGHVVPALIRKTHEAKRDGTSLTIWGTGSPRREFLYVDDCADACVFLMTRYSDAEPVNVGSGSDISILELAQIVSRVVGFDGPVEQDPSKPDGTPRKLMDNGKLTGLGWRTSISLEDGLVASYRWFREHYAR